MEQHSCQLLSGTGDCNEIMGQSCFLEEAIEKWEDEGGVAVALDHWLIAQGMLDPGSRPALNSVQTAESKMTGTPGQIEWAKQIRLRVGSEFDRVARAFEVVAGNQTEQARTDTEAVIAILGEKREEVMANCRAGYYIREWQEVSDQVRRLVAQDCRYQTIKANRAARRG
jgi:hypothetical protein